jgi:hypothetical protein
LRECRSTAREPDSLILILIDCFLFVLLTAAADLRAADSRAVD